MHRLALPACLLCLLATPLVALPAFAESVSTPAQAAYLKAQTRRINDHYRHRLAEISGVPFARVRATILRDGRLTDEVARSIAVLEKERGQPLSDAQKQDIANAERERRAALAAARSAAAHK